MLQRCTTCGRWRGTDEATGLELTSCTCSQCRCCGSWAPRLHPPPSTNVRVRLGKLSRCADCWRKLANEPAGIAGLELEDERLTGFYLGAVAGGVYRGAVLGMYCVLVTAEQTLVHHYQTNRTMRAGGSGRAVTTLLLALLAASERN